MKYPAIRFAMAALIASAAVISAAPAFADETAAIKERQKLMRAMGKGMSNTSKMLQGKIDYNADAVAEMVKEMQASAQQLPTLFPEGTDTENALLEYGLESDAKAEIWQNMDDFKAKAEALAAAAAAAAPSTADKDAFGKAVGGIGKSCKGCHTDYKKPDEK